MSKKKQRLQDSIGDIDSVDTNDDTSLEEVEKRDPNNPLTMQEAFDKMYIRGDERRGANAKKGKQSAAEVFAQLRGKKSLAIRDVSDIQIGAFTVTSQGLQINSEESTPEDWNIMGELLFNLEGSIQWLIGDWLAFGEDVGYGDYASVAEALGRKVGTLYDYAMVSRAYEFSRRLENLSYGHHRSALDLPPEARVSFLQRAEQEGWSVSECRRQIRLMLNAPEEVYDNVHTPFDKARMPSVTPTSSKLQRWWMGARQGDTTSRKNLRDVIAQYRKWLQELEDGLD
jgi:hypothetical protein